MRKAESERGAHKINAAEEGPYAVNLRYCLQNPIARQSLGRVSQYNDKNTNVSFYVKNWKN
jgi:hypothetical protein